MKLSEAFSESKALAHGWRSASTRLLVGEGHNTNHPSRLAHPFCMSETYFLQTITH